MSATPTREPVTRSGLEGLVDPVDLEALARHAVASDAEAPPLRRDLHLFALGAVALVAAVSVGTAMLASPSRSTPSAARPTGGDIAPGPASTAELEAAIRDQIRDPSENAPRSALAAAASLPAAPARAFAESGFAALPADAASAGIPGAARSPSSEADGLREARLADEAERRRADVLGSPLLAAVGGSRGGALLRSDAAPALPEALAGWPFVPGTVPSTLPASPPVGTGTTGSRLARGTLLPAVLLTEVRSDLPGTLIAQVTQTIWDTVTGDRVLVPQGARLIGEYGSDLRPGRERLLAVFNRLVWPDGRVLDLGRLAAVDAQGRSGLADQVDTRFAQRFGAGFLVAGLASLLAPRERQPATVVVVPAGGVAVSGLGAAAGTVLVETTRAILEQQRNAPPVVVVRQGHRFNVIVQEDLPVGVDASAALVRPRSAEDADVAASR